MPTIEDWSALKVRTGRVIRAEPNHGAHHPALCLWIDFGEHGQLQSSAKIADRYRPEDLVGRDVVAVTGFEPIRVNGFRSDVLILGAVTPEGVVLLRPDDDVDAGTIVA